jgi:hydroxymethylbilane synthase
LEGDCKTAVGAIANINDNKINLEAELFSLDGKQRFYHKASKEIELSSLLGIEVGEILKKESKNSYKK